MDAMWYEEPSEKKRYKVFTTETPKPERNKAKERRQKID